MKYRLFLILSLSFTFPLEGHDLTLRPAVPVEFGTGVIYKETRSDRNRVLKVSIFYPTHTHDDVSEIDQAEVLRWVRAYEDQNINPFVNMLNRYFFTKPWQMRSAEVEDLRTKLKAFDVCQQRGQLHAEGKFPVVYLLPEYAFNPSSYSVLIQSLVGRGYVVIATHHLDVSACVTHSDGAVSYACYPEAAHIKMRFDLDYLMKHLKNREDLNHICDFDNVAVIGHGVGGHVLQSCDTEEMHAVKAKVMLDHHARNYLHDETPTYYVLSSSIDSLYVAGLKNYVPDNKDHYLRLMSHFAYGDFSDDQRIFNLLDMRKKENFETQYRDFVEAIIAFLNRYLKGMDEEVPVSS